MNGQDTMPDELKDQIARLCDQQREGLTQIVQTIIAQQLETTSRAEADDSEERRTLDRIKEKLFCSANEGAMLLGCSAQHLRNLADKAIKGGSATPIPYADLDGVLVFPVQELLTWARQPKLRQKKGPENKSHLQAVAGGKGL